LWKSLNSGRDDGRCDTDMMSNIIEIQDVGIFYIKVNLRLDLIVTEGFVYRPYTTNTRKETLNDYIYASTEVLELILQG
jgi:hypothetical protein